MSIASEITRLQNAKSNLKSKLQDKGVSVGNERLDEMVNLVENIQGGSGTDTTDATATSSDILLGKTAYVNDEKIEGTIETYSGENEGGEVVERSLKKLLDNTKSAYYLFNSYQGDNLSELIQYNDTENVTDFRTMYQSCYIATEFPQIDTHLGTNFGSMYSGCSGATTFPQIDTSKGTNFKSMYQGCNKATSLPNLNTDLGTNFGSMYRNCWRVKKIDISKFTSISTSGSSSFCGGNGRLKALIIRSFGDTYVLNSDAFIQCYNMLGETHSTDNPNGEQGYIYVPRDMISILQNETNWSTMQFRALEDYTLDGTTTGEFDDEKAGI